MKKFFSSVLLSILVFITSAYTCFATFHNVTVTDKANYLSESQLNELSQQLDEIRKKYSFDVAIYTEKTISGSDAENTADDLYDYSLYGFGDHADGIMLYIAADERAYHFTTHGSGQKIFNDNGLAYLAKKILPSLKNNDYYTAMKLYTQHCEELLKIAAQGKPFNQKQLSMEYVGVIVGCAVLLPLLFAFLMTRGKMKKMKTAVHNNYAANYIKDGSMNVNFSRDIFLYSTITKTEKPKSNSGTHTSSSGENHGGRGGNF